MAKPKTLAKKTFKGFKVTLTGPNPGDPSGVTLIYTRRLKNGKWTKRPSANPSLRMDQWQEVFGEYVLLAGIGEKLGLLDPPSLGREWPERGSSYLIATYSFGELGEVTISSQAIRVGGDEFLFAMSGSIEKAKALIDQFG